MLDTAKPLVWRRDSQTWPELERGEFCYRREFTGRVKWLHFWPRDSLCPITAAIEPQRNGCGASWRLGGTDAAPSLFPSVDAGLWHGWLTDGVAHR